MATLASDRSAIELWLEAFDEQTRRSLMQRCESARGIVIGPLQVTADLLLSPASRIPELFDCIRRVVRPAAADAEFTWLLETGTPGATGPALEDLHALFADWMCVTDIAMAQVPGRAVVSARMRKHVVSFVVDLTQAPRESDWVSAILRSLKLHGREAETKGGFAVFDYDTLRSLKGSAHRELMEAFQEGWLKPVLRAPTNLSKRKSLSRHLLRVSARRDVR